MPKQLYEQNSKNIVTSNCTSNIGQQYYIDTPCKKIKRRYRLYEIISKVTILIILTCILLLITFFFIYMSFPYI